MSKHPWTPAQLPYLRRALVRHAATEAARHTRLADGLRSGRFGNPSDSALRDSIASFDEGAAAYDRQIGRWSRAELFWVTHAMADIALDASLDCPALRPDHDAPAPNGLVVFAKPLPPFPTEQIDGLALRRREGDLIEGPLPELVDFHGEVPVDGLGWMLDAAAGMIDILLLCRDHRLPHPLSPDDPPLLEFMRVSVRVPAAFDDAPAADEEVVSDSGLAIARLLSTIWVQMQIPTVVNRTSMDGEWGGAPTNRTRPEHLVNLVDLRPLRKVTTGDEPGEGRKLMRRHIVRGHWTHQPYGPGRAQRRLQWRAPYIKGPEGAPLVPRERVNVWRR